jgi:hypothetical protein
MFDDIFHRGDSLIVIKSKTARHPWKNWSVFCIKFNFQNLGIKNQTVFRFIDHFFAGFNLKFKF